MVSFPAGIFDRMIVQLCRVKSSFSFSCEASFKEQQHVITITLCQKGKAKRQGFKATEHIPDDVDYNKTYCQPDHRLVAEWRSGSVLGS